MQSILVSVFYSKPQRLDVFVDKKLVAPTNAKWNADNTDYTLKKPIYAGTKALHAHAHDVTVNQLRPEFFCSGRSVDVADLALPSGMNHV